MAHQTIAWANFFVLILSSLLFLLFYGLSVSPAGLARVMGERAYRRCAHYRAVSFVFEGLTLINFGLYLAFPLITPIPAVFPWSRWVSVSIGLAIGLPALALMVKGMLDAGPESIAPQDEQGLFRGIYTKIRHPQALGEMFLWTAAAFLLNKPFLALVSTIYYPIFLITMWMEEQDLILRFGQTYVDYIQRTGFIFLKPRSGGDPKHRH